MTDGGYYVGRESLPELYPTHLHSSLFWEQLGRTVATFGFLEGILGRAIFAFTATRSRSESEVMAAYKGWQKDLEEALYGTLGKLADKYGEVAKAHQTLTSPVDDLVKQIKAASTLRNILCHASWEEVPDAEGKSLPFFVNRKMEVVESKMDVSYLREVQNHVVGLACDVIDSVTQMGYRFPGSRGLGENHLASSGVALTAQASRWP